MKQLFCIMIFAACGVVNISTVRGDDGEKHKKPELTKEEMSKIFFKYVDFGDANTVSFVTIDLTKKEALKLGITAEEYKHNVDNVNVLNDTLSALRSRGEKVWNITQKSTVIKLDEK